MFVALLMLAGCSSGGSGSDSSVNAREELLRARAMNQAYEPFTTDSVMKEVVDWYDRHGTPSERMEAHYLLGCAYRDLGEALQALQCYQDAVNIVGNASERCNRANVVGNASERCNLLIRIYGQMAELYDAQNLPDDEIAAMKQIQHYALMAHDSLMYIRAVELMTKPYYKQGDTAKVIETVWEAHRLYNEAGDSGKAANAFATLAHIMVRRGRLAEADSLLREYESKTGLFDSLGNIAVGHEMYYYIKGNYYLAVGKTDAAEALFRRLVPGGATPGSVVNYYPADAYRGLLSVCQKRRQPDSIAKYARLFEAATDSLNNRRRIEAVHQMAALYDYHRLQKKADMAALAAADARSRMNLAVVLVVLTLMVVCVLFFRYRRSKQKELDKMSGECLVVSGLLAKARMELDEERRTAEERMKETHDCLQTEMQEKLEEKSAEVKELEARLKLLEEHYHSVTQLSSIEARKNSEAVRAIRRRAEWKHGATLPSADEWIKLTNQFRLDFPHYYATLCQGKKLATMEIRTCILLMLDFKEGEIAVLLDVKPQRVTNIKKRANTKLFGDESATTLTSNIEKASCPV